MIQKDNSIDKLEGPRPFVDGGEEPRPRRSWPTQEQASETIWAGAAPQDPELAERLAELVEENARLVREIGEHKHTHAELLRRNRELLSLQTAAAATASSLDLPFVLDTVAWEMANLLEVQSCAIYEWNQEADAISLMVEYGQSDWSPGEISLADYPDRRRVLTERCVHQAHADRLDADTAEMTYLQKMNARVLLLLPMVFQDRLVGLVEIRDGRNERVFVEHEITVAEWLAAEAARAIENARLYEQARRDLEERIRTEERLKASLEEKEVLLKEIHHRVKNNLQVISSLLYLQSSNIEDEQILAMFRDSQSRVRAMALIHEKLYQSPDLSGIRLADYLENLTGYLTRSYRVAARPVAVRVEGDDVALSIDVAIPCGLIANELVSNSLKHAFPAPSHNSAPGVAPSGQAGEADDREGEILIEFHLQEDRQLVLSVRDNGVGFPPDVDFRDTPSLGLQLVNSLVTQLGGTLELHSNGGTEFRIVFRAA
jgi:two-component sensor histidine kinase